MKNILKNERGINLISLILTVIVLLILTSITLYNLKDNLGMEKLQDMQSDIKNLKDRVASFYADYGEIPAEIEYTNVEHLRNAGIISGAVDTGKFYVIDLSSIQNLTLNYGQDYKLITEGTTTNEVNELKDLYIINGVSHNIFYVGGIKLDAEIYYTNYGPEAIDTKTVDLAYVDNVRIPDGYAYINGDIATGINIKNVETGKIYTWVVVEENITEVPIDITIEDGNNDEFLRCVNRYDGYYINDEYTAIYIPETETWTPIYDKTSKYEDKNGDVAYIPQGFKVSRKPGENTIVDGLVISDEEGNQFVWIPVDKATFDTKFKRTEGYDTGTLQTDLLRYCGEANATGTNSQITESSTTQAEAKAMYASVKSNGGFYIGRYEAGKDSSGNVVSKKGANVYNNIKWGNSMTDDTGGAVEVSRNFVKTTYIDKGKTAGVVSTLVYGVQWDAALNFIDPNYITNESEEGKPTCASDSYLVDSKGQGWYGDNYEEGNPAHKTGIDVSDNSNSQKNIYDMGGNIREWTMESCYSDCRVNRGGYYYNDGSGRPASQRNTNDPSSMNNYFGFRLALYMQN